MSSVTDPKGTISFTLPPDLVQYLSNLDAFIADQITPLQSRNDNDRFFDHRREHARTDWDNQGLPRPEWEDLLHQCVQLADKAGFYRFSLPRQYGGQNDSPSGRGCNLWMAVIREHLAAKGLGLFNDLQTEHSVVGNFPDLLLVQWFGTKAQKEVLIPGRLEGRVRITFGLTEPGHGSDATFMETRAVREVRGGVEGWRIDGRKMWQTGMHRATHCLVFARTAGRDGEAEGISCFVVPREAEGVRVESYEWTLNMPTDHATISLHSVFLPDNPSSPTPTTPLPISPLLGPLHHGLQIAQAFVHENRLRQAASSLGAARYCLSRSIAHARTRAPFKKPLYQNQAVQFPLSEQWTQVEMLELLIQKTAVEMDEVSAAMDAASTCGAAAGAGFEVAPQLSAMVSMCNFWSNRLCTQAADLAIQVHGGLGYSRHLPFEHLWRHHRRYRITEGSEEIQVRNVGRWLFGVRGGKAGKEGEAKL
ncbi:acyl-CoA dehydrogenase NM domain-like protein [Saccharata proteae CBS 121410]|uniref:Acyl-CoA dehydrogenase NM domain-like protein n=1 Tax=Saccharata proteae CBS 121410 TaxID=1314787 RepID=A0A9P4HNM5_9PEZI|nr:acyl-CoA dehydrogenase NM domain-like protein [Saccharata proteae CBS 121410]